jgi:adenylate cyclase
MELTSTSEKQSPPWNRKPAKSVSASGLWRRLVGNYAFYTFVTFCASIALIAFGIDLNRRQILLIITYVAPVTLLMVLAIDLLVLDVHYRPIGRFLRALEADQPTASLAKPAFTQALNFPLLSLFRVIVFHGLTGNLSVTLLFYLYLNPVHGAGIEHTQVAISWGTLLTAVPAHAIFEYFTVLGVMRTVIPTVRHHCESLPDDSQRQYTQVKIRVKLLFLSVFITFIPLLVLASTTVIKVNNLLAEIGFLDALEYLTPLVIWMAALITFIMLVTVGMSLLMAREVNTLAGDLAQAMRKVADGKLETQLEVTSTDEYAELNEGFNNMALGLQERERLRDAFSRYVAPELAEQVMQHGVSLGGQLVNASVLFADIRDFTALVEKETPMEVVALLNAYFAAVEPVIQAEGGWINRFGGDSLLAVFGAPLSREDHIQQAVRAALRIREAVGQLNAQLEKANQPSIRIGIGIHTGEMIAGNVGSPARMEYTVHGDVVNLASRIDGLNKEWGTEILVSEEVFTSINLGDNARAMPAVNVKGKTRPIQVYALD